MESPSKLQLVYNFTIALLGLIGNTTTIFVFSQRRLRSLRSSFFLTCLAVTDLVFILILIVALLDQLQVPVMTAPICMSTIYLSHIASFLSSNFTLAYTSHRLIAVLFPIKATTFLKQRTNRVLALALLIFACLFYSLSFPVITTTARSNTTNTVNCKEDETKKLLFPFIILDTLFTFIIPFSLITCMNLTIVYKLQTKLTYKQKLSIATPSAKSSTNSSGQSVTESAPTTQINNVSISKNSVNQEVYRLLQQQQQNRSLLCVRPMQRYKGLQNRSVSLIPNQRRASLYHTNKPIRIRSTQCRATASAKTTKMLLAASTVFLVFNLPYHLLIFCFLIAPTQPPWMSSAVDIARLWFFASFCVNFFVYAICGQRFRSEVVRLFSCSIFRRYFDKREQKIIQERQNSFYLNQRLMPISLTRLSHSN
ncbi:unnamed protein product [Adineta steineri]|uniref:G-protein coupled receptors family 1 profile domain-containing protein n=1 Tax=Adineta steineri TaxID=433720 RepID=A0A819F869_9BILA|nr:unnamed protein product [Adineta steineri]CAF3864237.1 unnamed protein product [Adineta steineri]